MNKTVLDCVSHLETGNLVEVTNMAVVPLFASNPDGLAYITLDEAVERKVINITELNSSGSVPELRVINAGNIPVLLLDGEELLGAKQNRVLNTTILLREQSETTIPVSCVEQGRWSYMTGSFRPSFAVMPSTIRKAKSRSVSVSLNVNGQFKSDQGEVWNEVREYSIKSGVDSPTEALNDAVNARAGDINAYLDAFPCLPEQKGLLVFINGEIAGFDIVSRAAAYKLLHPKLIRSYAADAVIDYKTDAKASLIKAGVFLEKVQLTSEREFQSVGYGQDYRYNGKNIAGSALVCEGAMVHAAFFPMEEVNTPNSRMTGCSKRRAFRVE